MMSLADYAKRRGVSAMAVSKAVAAGRLTASVVRDARGAPKIADPELADREWEANTRQRIERTASAPTARVLRLVPPVAPSTVAEPLVARAPRGSAATTDYNESRARREAALAGIAELELTKRRGDLVQVNEARADVVARFTLVRTRLLGVPSRVAQRLPHLAGEVVPVLDALLREALEELCVDGGQTHDGEP